MDNREFRKMLSSTPGQHPAGSPPGYAKPSLPASSLGSRSRSSFPMTPRTVKGGQGPMFAQQLADQNGTAPKKFRSMAAPKGTKLAAGYHDRTQDRQNEQDNSNREDKAARIRALEEQQKLGQIDEQTFGKLRDSITGGDIGATHLVKGLDRRLLERVKRGEDVMNGDSGKEAPAAPQDDREPARTADEEFEELENQEVAPIEREKVVKRGEKAAPVPVAGMKRSRNDILAELKASRQAAQAEAQAASQLGSKFRKLGETRTPGPRIERDEKGREVLITVDERGRVKRKVRKVAQERDGGLLMPDKTAKPLGMEVPVVAQVPGDDSDDDIFQGAGTSYDPLGAAVEESGSSSSSSSSEESDTEAERTAARKKKARRSSRTLSSISSRSQSRSRSRSRSQIRSRSRSDSDSDSDSRSASGSRGSKSPPPRRQRAGVRARPRSPASASSRSSRSHSRSPSPDRRTADNPAPAAAAASGANKRKNNYFNDTPSTRDDNKPGNPLKDPSILASLRRAAALAEAREKEDQDAGEQDRRGASSSAAARLAARDRDRDMDDIDMGFGSSRFDDAEDEEGGAGARVKLSEWKGNEGDEDDEGDEQSRKRGGTSQRKRGKKKRKGDKNSAADVLRLVENRKK